MSLVGPWLSTTSTKKREQKITKAKMAEFEQGWRDRNVRLKQMGLPKETFEEYMDWVHGRSKKETSKKKNRATGTSSVTDSTKKVAPRLATVDYENNDSSRYIKIAKGIPRVIQDWPPAPCTVKQAPTYTGTKMIGIGVMHKSNAVPIFSDNEAKEISSMRR